MTKAKEIKKKKSSRGILDTGDRRSVKNHKRYVLYAGYITSAQARRAAASLRKDTKGTLAYVKKNPDKLEPWEVWVHHAKPFWGSKGGGMETLGL